MPNFESDGGLAIGEARTISWALQGDPASFKVEYIVTPLLPDGSAGARRRVVLTTTQKNGSATVTVAGRYAMRFLMTPRFAGDRAHLRWGVSGGAGHNLNLPYDGDAYSAFFSFSIAGVPLPEGGEAPPAVESPVLPPAEVEAMAPAAAVAVQNQQLAPVSQDTLARTKYRVITPLRFVRDRDGALVQRQRYVSVRYLSPNNVASLTAQGYEIQFVDSDTPESASAPYGPSVLARARDRRPGEARIRWDRQRGSRQRRTIQQITAERYGGEYERAPAIRAPTRRVVR